MKVCKFIICININWLSLINSLNMSKHFKLEKGQLVVSDNSKTWDLNTISCQYTMSKYEIWNITWIFIRPLYMRGINCVCNFYNMKEELIGAINNVFLTCWKFTLCGIYEDALSWWIKSLFKQVQKKQCKNGNSRSHSLVTVNSVFRSLHATKMVVCCWLCLTLEIRKHSISSWC